MKNNVVAINRNANRVVTFQDIRPGIVFRVLKSEIRKRDFYDLTGKKGIRVVKNDGTYIKIADSHAHDMTTGKDAIFALRMPCRVLSTQPNEQFVKLLPDFAIVNQGKPADVQVAKRA